MPPGPIWQTNNQSEPHICGVAQTHLSYQQNLLILILPGLADAPHHLGCASSFKPALCQPHSGYRRCTVGFDHMTTGRQCSPPRAAPWYVLTTNSFRDRGVIITTRMNLTICKMQPCICFSYLSFGLHAHNQGDLLLNGFLTGVLRSFLYLVCSPDQRRSQRGFHWMSCSHCGICGGCGLALREEGTPWARLGININHNLHAL